MFYLKLFMTMCAEIQPIMLDLIIILLFLFALYLIIHHLPNKQNYFCQFVF